MSDARSPRLSRLRLSSPVLLLISLAGSPALAPHHSSGHQQGYVTVQVRDHATGNGIPDAALRLEPTAYGTRLTVATDVEGRARFDGVLPGSYRISVKAAGYALQPVPAPSAVGYSIAFQVDVQHIVVSAGGTTEVVFSLRRGSRLVALVSKATGGPLAGAKVELLTEIRTIDGGLVAGFESLRAPGGTTDATGRVVVDGLPAGHYYLRLALPPSHGGATRFVYSPGVHTAAESLPVEIVEGTETLAAIAIPGDTGVPVQGRAVTPDGHPVPGADVYLTAVDGSAVPSRSPVARTDDAGAFLLTDVFPGSYSLQVARRRPGAPAPALTGGLALSVGMRPVEDLVVTAVPPARISGRILFNGQETADPGRTEVEVVPESLAARLRGFLVARPEWHADGRFEVAGVLGAHRIDATASGNWYLQGVFLDDGTNVTWAPYDFVPGHSYTNVRVMMSDATASLTVKVPEGTASDQALLVVFPEDATWWARGSAYVKTYVLRTPAAVEHRFTGLAPGLTYLVATFGLPINAGIAYFPTSPGLLETLAPSARRVNVWGPDAFSVTLGSANR